MTGPSLAFRAVIAMIYNRNVSGTHTPTVHNGSPEMSYVDPNGFTVEEVRRADYQTVRAILDAYSVMDEETLTQTDHERWTAAQERSDAILYKETQPQPAKDFDDAMADYRERADHPE